MACSRSRCASRRDKLDYRFRLRPEARFFDGTRVTAADVAFSLNVLKEKGHPIYAQLLSEVESATAEGDDVVHVRFVEEPQPRRPSHRRRHAGLLRRVVEGPRLRRRDARRAARLRPLQGQDASSRAASSNSSGDPNYWGAKLPVNRRPEQFRPAALRILPRAAGRLRGVQGRRDQLSRGVHLALLGDVLRLSRRQGRAGQEGGAARRLAVAHAGLVSQHAARAVQGPARPRGDRPLLRFRMDEQEHHVFVLQADRLVLPQHDMEAKGKPGPDELKLLEPFRGQALARRVRRALRSAGQRRLGLRPQAAEAGLRPLARGGLQARRLDDACCRTASR